jgi:Arc/MetJ family transcription regulator
MATNLNLDDRLIEKARRAGKHKTKKEAVTVALQEYIKMRGRRTLVDMAGTVEFWPGFDHRELRRRKSA